MVLLSLNNIIVRIVIVVMGSVIKIDYNHDYFYYDIDLLNNGLYYTNNDHMIGLSLLSLVLILV